MRRRRETAEHSHQESTQAAVLAFRDDPTALAQAYLRFIGACGLKQQPFSKYMIGE